MDQPAEKDAGAVDVERVQGRIEFRNVSFSYDGGQGQPVLKQLDFVIEPGQTVALVGKSGSGKSTLASLLPRFYDATAGEILLDGRALASYRLSALRRQVALVTQQVTLFNDTLERNIAYGALAGSDPAAIRDAVVRAHADIFIDELPDGLATLVGDDGVLLSGGQRQRVAIARALLKDAPVLILDEATSALDTESERHIQAALEEVMRGRTTLVIAHRLSTIERADIILVMEDGRIVESGAHAELLARGGAYAALYEAQFEDAPRPTQERAPRRPMAKPRLPTNVSWDAPSPVLRGWYEGAWWVPLLAPLAWAFRRAAARRRRAYTRGRRTPWRAPVPVIVVGNIAIGGTGKTPLVVWLARTLADAGFRPGIVSRGYGGKRGREPLAVTASSDPERSGDEAVLLAQRTGCPVVVCSDRPAAVRHLLAEHDCDLVIADDGLQHYALARDLEIAVVDGARGLGNGRCLPAGPLREPPARLGEVDLVVVNGPTERDWTDLAAHVCTMTVVPREFVRLHDGERVDAAEFAQRSPRVHAVAGVGNPARFAVTLQQLGMTTDLHPYPDHHRFNGTEMEFDDDWPVVCTEKDAVKLRRLESVSAHAWYLEIDVDLEEDAVRRLIGILRERGIRGTGR